MLCNECFTTSSRATSQPSFSRSIIVRLLTLLTGTLLGECSLLWGFPLLLLEFSWPSLLGPHPKLSWISVEGIAFSYHAHLGKATPCPLLFLFLLLRLSHIVFTVLLPSVTSRGGGFGSTSAIHQRWLCWRHPLCPRLCPGQPTEYQGSARGLRSGL